MLYNKRKYLWKFICYEKWKDTGYLLCDRIQKKISVNQNTVNCIPGFDFIVWIDMKMRLNWSKINVFQNIICLYTVLIWFLNYVYFGRLCNCLLHFLGSKLVFQNMCYDVIEKR